MTATAGFAAISATDTGAGTAPPVSWSPTAAGRRAVVLLQHRAAWTASGNTWGIPGGARDSHESPAEGALREACEETGIPQRPSGWAASWSTTTAAGPTHGAGQPWSVRWSSCQEESAELRWVPVSAVTDARPASRLRRHLAGAAESGSVTRRRSDDHGVVAGRAPRSQRLSARPAHRVRRQPTLPSVSRSAQPTTCERRARRPRRPRASSVSRASSGCCQGSPNWSNQADASPSRSRSIRYRRDVPDRTDRRPDRSPAGPSGAGTWPVATDPARRRWWPPPAPAETSPAPISSRIRRRTGSPRTSRACILRPARPTRRGRTRPWPRPAARAVSGSAPAAMSACGPALGTAGGEGRAVLRQRPGLRLGRIHVRRPGQVVVEPEQAEIPADAGGAGTELGPEVVVGVLGVPQLEPGARRRPRLSSTVSQLVAPMNSQVTANSRGGSQVWISPPALPST